jgi:hypothetical protein
MGPRVDDEWQGLAFWRAGAVLVTTGSQISAIAKGAAFEAKDARRVMPVGRPRGTGGLWALLLQRCSV